VSEASRNILRKVVIRKVIITTMTTALTKSIASAEDSA
jgi:hypothetical protein